MSPERWQQIKQLFQAALAQDACGREAFLAAACAGDDDLLRQVEAMLSADAQSDEMLDRPAYAAVPELLNLPENQSQLMTAPLAESLVGRRIGVYQLVREIGRGGMGEVYLAHDARLGRNVALKLLPARFTQDAERVRRFQREARTASALNHPNILTIFDIGQEDGLHYIATEFVEGQTLRALIGSAEMTLGKAIDAAMQIASALEAAHKAGIVHRDIKPENVMVRPDGYAKVLDFGLAKLTEQDSSPREGETAATRSSVFETQAGVILGTVSYMSPEQARGLKVDARSDLFSLGVVLYEMLTGARPFTGATRNHVLVAILDHEPQPLPDALSPELQRTVNRMLAKERDERFQSTGELIEALREMKEELISSGHSRRASSGDLQDRNTAADGSAASTGAISTVARMKRRGALALAAVALIAIAALVAVKWFDWRQSDTPPFAKMRLARLSTLGESSSGVISPDGKYVLYGDGEPGINASLRLKQLAGGGDVELVPPGKNVFIRYGFSPDSNFVYYAMQDVPGQLIGTIYSLPIIGGAQPRKVPVKTAFPMSNRISPDGKRIIVLHRNSEVLVANLNDGAEQVLFKGPDHSQIVGAYWTRDGTQIIYSMREVQPGRGAVYNFIVRNIADGNEQVILPWQAGDYRNMDCLPGRRGLLALMMDQATGLYQLYHVGYDGAVRRLTQDLNDYLDVTVASDGKTAALAYQEQVSTLHLAPLTAPQRAAPITNWSGVINAFVWRRDGRILYSQTDNNSAELWQVAIDGGRPTQLTAAGGINNYPAVSADDRFIVFSSTRTGSEDIWRMDADGGNPARMTTEGGSRPQLSPDGRWIVYEDKDQQQQSLWKLPLEGGVPVRLTVEGMRNPAISPDGKWVAGERWDAATRKWRLAVIPFEGDAPARVFDAVVGYGKLRWTNDGQALVFLAGHSAGFSQVIRLQPLDGSPARILFSIAKEKIFWFDLSPDGKQIAYRAGRQIMPTALLTEVE